MLQKGSESLGISVGGGSGANGMQSSHHIYVLDIRPGGVG